jgi:hypothetical protein
MSEPHHDTARSSQSAVKDRWHDERKCRAAFSDEEISSETSIPTRTVLTATGGCAPFQLNALSAALLLDDRLRGLGGPGVQVRAAHLHGVEPGLIILHLPVQILAALVQLAAFVDGHNAPPDQGAGGGELESTEDWNGCTHRHVFLLSLGAFELRFSGLQLGLCGIDLPFEELQLREVGAAAGHVLGFEVEAVVEIAQRQQHHPNGPDPDP